MTSLLRQGALAEMCRKKRIKNAIFGDAFIYVFYAFFEQKNGIVRFRGVKKVHFSLAFFVLFFSF